MRSPKGYNLQLTPCNQRQWQDSCEQSNPGFLIMALLLYRRIAILLKEQWRPVPTNTCSLVFWSCTEWGKSMPLFAEDMTTSSLTTTWEMHHKKRRFPSWAQHSPYCIFACHLCSERTPLGVQGHFQHHFVTKTSHAVTSVGPCLARNWC